MNSPIHAVSHYENFPVASWLVPHQLRPAVVALYHFARHADDLADEGDVSTADRLHALSTLRADCKQARAGQPVASATISQLAPHMARWHLDWNCLDALLSAFEQDVTVRRYADEAALMDYCARSANPIGHLMLQLFGQFRPEQTKLADGFCSGLQRLNFLQDIAIDWQRGRLYLPYQALQAHGLSEADLDQASLAGRAGHALRACLHAEAHHIDRLLQEGAMLATSVGGRLGWELRAMVASALCVRRALHRGGYDPFRSRPRLRWYHTPYLLTTFMRLASGASRSVTHPIHTA